MLFFIILSAILILSIVFLIVIKNKEKSAQEEIKRKLALEKNCDTTNEAKVKDTKKKNEEKDNKESKKETTKQKKNLLKEAFVFTAFISTAALIALTIVVCAIQFSPSNSHEAIEKERIYLTYKVENNEYYNTDVVSRIDKFNKSIDNAKENIKNPWFGCFYTKTRAETEPIIYQIIIPQNTTTAE